MTEQTPKDKAIKHLEIYYGDPSAENIKFIDVEEAIDIALSELQKQHEAELKNIREIRIF